MSFFSQHHLPVGSVPSVGFPPYNPPVYSTPPPRPQPSLAPMILMMLLAVGITALVIWWRKRGALQEAEETLAYVSEMGNDEEGREAQAEALAASIMDIARNKVVNLNLSPTARLRYGMKTMQTLADEMDIEIDRKVWARAFGLASRQFGPGMRAPQTMFQLGG